MSWRICDASAVSYSVASELLENRMQEVNENDSQFSDIIHKIKSFLLNIAGSGQLKKSYNAGTLALWEPGEESKIDGLM